MKKHDFSGGHSMCEAEMGMARIYVGKCELVRTVAEQVPGEESES